MVPHRRRTSDAKARPRIARLLPSLDELLQLGIMGRDVDLDRHQLIAALTVLGDEPPPLEPQDFARGRAFGNGEHYGAVGCRYLNLRAEHGLLESDRQFEPNVVPLTGVEAVRGDLDRD